MTRSLIIRMASAGCVLAISAALAGCSSSGQAPTPEPSSTVDTSAWAETIKAAGAASKSPFAEQVAADGVITKAEFDEMLTQLKSCMTDRGYNFRITVEGEGLGYGYKLNTKDEAADDAALSACEKTSGTLALKDLYQESRANPANKNVDQARADCLNAAGLGPGNLTAAQAKEANTTLGMTGRNPIADGPQADACLTNPFGAQPLPVVPGLIEDDGVNRG